MTHAIRIHEYGGPEVLRWEEVAVGDPGPGELRIRHGAIGLNYIDVYHRTGLYPLPSLPWIPGMEGAGRVEARENRIEVFPADPSAERVVIRYNWRDGLVCRTPGASIEPFPVDENLRFIAVHPGGNEKVRIGYRPHGAPVKPNFDGTFHH